MLIEYICAFSELLIIGYWLLVISYWLFVSCSGLTHGGKKPWWLSPSAELILSVVEGFRINSAETLCQYLSVARFLGETGFFASRTIVICDRLPMPDAQ